MMLRILLTTLAVLAALGGPAPAWAGEGSPATLSLDSTPPAPTAPLPDWMAYQDHYAAAQRDTRVAHMTHEELSLWAEAAVTEALTVPQTGYEQKLSGQRAFFTDKGWGEYGRVLQDTRIMDTLRGGQGIATVTDGAAQVVNHGETGGHYRWVVSLPLMQSTTSGAGQRYTLMVDVIRIAMTGAATAGQDLRIDGMRLGNATGLTAPAAAPAIPTPAAP